MFAIEERGEQNAVIDAVRKCGHRQVVLCAKTGFGKSVCASKLVEGAIAKGNQCLFVVGGRLLVFQFADRLRKMGIHRGIIMAGEKKDPRALVQVASKDTLNSILFNRIPNNQNVQIPESFLKSFMTASREHDGYFAKIWDVRANLGESGVGHDEQDAMFKMLHDNGKIRLHKQNDDADLNNREEKQIYAFKRKKFDTVTLNPDEGPLDWLNPKLIIIDECDLYLEWQKRFIEKFPEAFYVGLTGTPIQNNGKAMGYPYSAIVCAPPTSELIQMGRIVPAKAFVPYIPDLTGVPIDSATKDYNKKVLAKKLDDKKLIGDAVEHWERLGKNRQTIVFCISRQHGRHVLDQFKRRGHNFAYLDGDTPDNEREEIFEGIRDCSIRGVVSIMAIGRGVDLPILSCAILLRPTRSLKLLLQNLGRVIRSHPGKADAIILDHSGAFPYHQITPNQDITWKLGSDEDPGALIRDGVEAGNIAELKICKRCDNAYQGNQCPECGLASFDKKTKEIVVENGNLVPLNEEVATQISWEQKNRFWQTCLWKAAYFRGGRGTVAMARAMYKSKYKTWPEDGFQNALPRNISGSMFVIDIPELEFMRKKVESRVTHVG